MARGTLVKYLRYASSGWNQSKLQNIYGKEGFTLEYTTPHSPQMNGVIEILFAIIKKGPLEMLLNAKLNEAAQKALWAEAVHR